MHPPYICTTAASGRTPPPYFDAIVVGAGFAGLFMLYRLRELGLSVVSFDAAGDVGGTWYWNRYPGARCDIESMQYSYSFSQELQQDWVWTERFATQQEILRYLNHVADRFDLRRLIKFNTFVSGATFNAADSVWIVNAGHEEVAARFCIMASGCLSSANVPSIAGYDDYAGRVYHTSRWPQEEVDFTGQSVAVIGTGSSGIQVIPEIAKRASRVVVFQRTPNYVIPARNAPLSKHEERRWKIRYAELRDVARYTKTGTIHIEGRQSALSVSEEERERQFQARWDQGGAGFLRAFTDLATNEQANEMAAEFVRRKIREIVEDPRTRETLLPKNFPIGAKRICVATDYFETFNRRNVELVDLQRSPIKRMVPSGIETTAGTTDVDSVVFATGFDAVTGPLLRMVITGRGQLTLQDKWTAGPRTYLGLMVAGFPNLFMITGPGSPAVISNVVVSIEQHVNWIAGCISYARSQAAGVVEAELDAEDLWTAHVSELASNTFFLKTDSWYLGANIPGKPRVFMLYAGGVGNYRRKCDEVVANGYQGFRFSGAGE